MLIVMQSHATEEQIRAVCDRIESLGLKAHPIPGSLRTAIGITGNKGSVDLGVPSPCPALWNVFPSASRTSSSAATPRKKTALFEFLRRRGCTCGAARGFGGWTLRRRIRRAMLDHCRTLEVHRSALFAAALQAAHFALQLSGARRRGLKILAKVRHTYGFGIITEAIDNESLDLVEEYADVIQIGARNMQNFSLLKRAGRAKKPVLLKRGMSATLDEFLMAAEYILSEGNYNVMLCERGVRTFSDFSRNTLDLAVVPAVKKRSHLPILVDQAMGPASATRFCRSRAPPSPLEPTGFSSRSITNRKRRYPTECNPFCRTNLPNSPRK